MEYSSAVRASTPVWLQAANARRGRRRRPSPISQADAASATVLAIEQQAKGVFNTVDDDPAQVREWMPYLAESAWAEGRPYPVAPVGGAVASRGNGEDRDRGQAFSNAKAKRELGWELRYSSWRQGFTDEFA